MNTATGQMLLLSNEHRESRPERRNADAAGISRRASHAMLAAVAAAAALPHPASGSTDTEAQPVEQGVDTTITDKVYLDLGVLAVPHRRAVIDPRNLRAFALKFLPAHQRLFSL